MESQSQVEKQQSPSPNKAGVHKVFFTCALYDGFHMYTVPATL